MRRSLGPRLPLASRVPGPELGGPGPLAILRRSGAAGEERLRGAGATQSTTRWEVAARGEPALFPGF